MEQPPALRLASCSDDRQLVRDAYRLLAGRRHFVSCGARGREHAYRDLLVRFTPARPDRIPEVLPVARIGEQPLATGYLPALELVRCFDEAVVERDREIYQRGNRRRGLARPLER